MAMSAAGLPGIGARRAVDVRSKMCEDCGVKQPSFGLPPELTKRWCSGCAKGHTGAVNVRSKKRRTE